MFGKGIRHGISVAMLCLGAIGSVPGPSHGKSAPAAAQDGADVLDQKNIHNEYNEGNFEAVTAALEGFMARNKTYRHADSVFIAKHLAVVYSANTATREKGKYFMYRLLELLPSAKLVDMYVSDEIDRIFDKVREEFIVRQRSFGVDRAQVGGPEKAPGNRTESKTGDTEGGRGTKKAYWIAGATGMVAAGFLAYFFLHGEEPPEDRVVTISE